MFHPRYYLLILILPLLVSCSERRKLVVRGWELQPTEPGLHSTTYLKIRIEGTMADEWKEDEALRENVIDNYLLRFHYMYRAQDTMKLRANTIVVGDVDHCYSEFARRMEVEEGNLFVYFADDHLRYLGDEYVDWILHESSCEGVTYGAYSESIDSVHAVVEIEGRE